MSDFPDWGGGGGGGGGGYLSLTGAGQTATPGELDQSGPFTVTIPVQPPGGTGFTVDDRTLNSGNPNGVPSIDILSERNPTRIWAGLTGAAVRPSVVVGGGNMQTINLSAIDFNTTVGLITVISSDLRMGIATGGNNSTIRCTCTGAPSSTPKIGFFGATPVALPGVGGSRGGNAALASLLTALASLGLIINSTTP
jgi:hypothetical protein